MPRLSVLAIAATAALMPLAAAGARQGPEPESSNPRAGSAMREAPSEVSMTFSEPLDPSSNIEVTDQCGRVVSGETDVAINEMSTPLTMRPKGHYTVNWTATGLAGASGTNKGAFAFHVHSGEPCDDDRNNNGNHNHNNGGNNNNHNNHGNKGDDHKGHDGGSGGDHNGPSHSTDHSSSSHSPADHMSGSAHDDGDHNGHKGQGGGRHEGHAGDKKHSGKHGQHGGDHGGTKQNGGKSIAEGPTGATENDALNLLLVMMLPALLGTAGGSVLRARMAG